MAKNVGVRLSDDLLAVLKRAPIGMLATFSEKGVPCSSPVHFVYPKGLDSILVTIPKDHEAYHNMVWQKKVMISFLEEGDVAYSVLGRAGVVRAPSLVHPLMNIVRIDVIDVRSDRSPLMRISQGVRWSYTSADADELSQNLLQELRELAKTL